MISLFSKSKREVNLMKKLIRGFKLTNKRKVNISHICLVIRAKLIKLLLKKKMTMKVKKPSNFKQYTNHSQKKVKQLKIYGDS